MSEMYKIGTVSKLCGVPAHVIRYYEELGLVSSRHINGSSTRYYDPFVFEQLLNIRMLRKLEFSIEEIQQIMSVDSLKRPFETHKVWEKKQKELSDRIIELQNSIKKLEDMKKGDYYWQLCVGKVLTVELPELYFYPQTLGDHSPSDKPGSIMEDVLEGLLPNIRKIALSREARGAFSVEFGFAIEKSELHKLSPEQQLLLKSIPGGEYYVTSAKVDRDCVILPEHAEPLYRTASAEGDSGDGVLMFELGYDGHLLCLLQKSK